MREKKKKKTHQKKQTKMISEKYRKTPDKKKKNQLTSKQKKLLNFFIEIMSTIAIFILFVWIASLFFFSFPKVTGYGMTPTLNHNERIFVNKKGTIKRFSMVYMKVPNKSDERVVRRIIGLLREEVQYKNDQLWVGNNEINERFLNEKRKEAKKNGEQYTEDFSTVQLSTDKFSRIPDGQFLVLGDNRPYASDSRFYGYVEEKDIIGTVNMRLLPIHKLTSY